MQYKKPEMKNKKPRIQKFTVKESCSLLEFLEQQFPGKARKSIRQMLQHSSVYVGNEIIKRANYSLNKEQVVSIRDTRTTQTVNISGIIILYKDEHIIVIDKPAGLLTVGTEKEKTKTAYSLLSSYVKIKNRNNKIFIVHRLDRDTSGILVFARNIKIRDILQENWHSDNHIREYAALVSGKIDKDQGRIESWLKENANYQVYSSYKKDDGQHAITNYSLIQQNEEFSLLKIIPETGRRNQIRVHLNDIGYPITGDRRYGNGQNPSGRLGLHASILIFLHPISKKIMRYESPPPASFKKFSSLKK